MLLAFLCKRGAVGESQSWESNFQVKSKSEEVQESHFWQVLKDLFSVGWRRHYWSIQLQFSQAGKPPIFLSQVDKSGGWWYMSPPWSWERRRYYVFPQTLQIYSTDSHLTLPNSQISTFVNQGLFFPLLPGYFLHICLLLMNSNSHYPKSSPPSPFCGHEVAVPPCGTLAPRQS